MEEDRREGGRLQRNAGGQYGMGAPVCSDTYHPAAEKVAMELSKRYPCR